jgi:hypothetical protein
MPEPDLGQGGHSSRHNQRLAGPGDKTDEGQVHKLKGGDLEGRDIHLDEELDGAGIKRRGKEGHAQVAGGCFELGLPVPGSIGLAVQVVEGAAGPNGASADAKVLAVRVDGQGVGLVGLELDGIGTGVVSGAQDLERLIEILVVVG